MLNRSFRKHARCSTSRLERGDTSNMPVRCGVRETRIERRAHFFWVLKKVSHEFSTYPENASVLKCNVNRSLGRGSNGKTPVRNVDVSDVFGSHYVTRRPRKTSKILPFDNSCCSSRRRPAKIVCSSATVRYCRAYV